MMAFFFFFHFKVGHDGYRAFWEEHAKWAKGHHS